MTDKDKKPYTPQERQAYVDSLPADQRNTDPKLTFNKLITRAAQPVQKNLDEKKRKD